MSDTDWIDRKEYPFDSHFFETKQGKMHYVDEGEGNPIVFIHGNPSWSFQFRNVIKTLSVTNRCIGPDMIGFGLSDKPQGFSYLPKDHAKIMDDFLESLGLYDITMVVGDWGGPIGLSYAINHPERIRNLVITNTWLWSVKNDWYYQAFSKIVGGPIGKILINTRNFFARDIVRMASGKKPSKHIHRHYLKPLENKKERKGSWVFPGQVVGSWQWLDSLWKRRTVLKDKKVLLAWGMKDIAFREKELKKWMNTFPDASVKRFENAGHFVAEEDPEGLTREMNSALKLQ
jgi:haloalkane dehalogenase